MDDYMYTNIKLNMDFQESYKRLDQLCKDCLLSDNGVSEYLRRMENKRVEFWQFHISWEEDYKILKHVRWIRNQLSHEVGTLQSDICTENDLKFVEDFYNRIINCADPFANLREAKEAERKRKKAQVEQYDAPQTRDCNESIPRVGNNPKKSAFSRFLEKIKRIFF